MNKMDKLLLVVPILLCVTAILLFFNIILIKFGVFDETCIINWIVALSPIVIALLIEMYILILEIIRKDD